MIALSIVQSLIVKYFNKAINAYVADPKKNLANLSKYAKDMGVYTKLMNVMEVLLNGLSVAASVLARLKNKAAESGRSYQLLFAALLSGRIFAPFGKIQICGKSRS